MSFQSVFWRTACAGALFLGFGACLTAHAATLTVNSTADTVADDGVLTLREAISAANSATGNSTIAFDANVFGTTQQTITITSPLTISGSVAIMGGTPGVTISGGLQTEILYASGPEVTLSNLTFIQGKPYNFTVQHYAGDLLVDHCAFAQSTAGLIHAPTSSGNLKVRNCTFSNSKGGLYSRGTEALVEGCTFTDGQEYGLGTSENAGTVTVQNCTFVRNFIGLFANSGTTLSVQHCTVAENTAEGVEFPPNSPPSTLSNSIVVGNGTGISNGADVYGTPSSSSSNITGGVMAAGLQTSNNHVLLADNGGPTQTIALLAGSPAINAGNSTFNADQRGVLRDTLPDIGAFEANSAPKIVVVAPQNASDIVTAKRTFTLTVKDPNGSGEIKEVELLINNRLNRAEGATLLYRPNASNVTGGQLLLSIGDKFLGPVAVGTGATTSTTIDNGALRIASGDVSISADADGRTITISIPATIRDGLVGTNTLFARIQDAAGATDPASAAGDNGYIRSGTYTVTPQFGGSNQAPTLSKLTPSATNTTLNSSSIAPAAQTFGFFFKDENGAGDMTEVWFLAGNHLGWKNTATFVYYPRTRRLVLRSDDGSTFLGGGQIGSAGILENSQVRVDLSKVKVLIYNDGKSLGLSLPLQAKSGLLGTNNIWLRVQDLSGATDPSGDAQGYVKSGAWNVKAVTGTKAATPNPSAGNS